MTLFDLLEWCGAALGFSSGAVVGAATHGWVGGIFGALVGTPLGWFVAHVPYLAVRLWFHIVLTREPVDELRARLRDRVMWPLFAQVMAELRRRGEDLRNELSVVTTLLADEGVRERHRGWEMLRCFFPDVAARIPDYDPAQPVAQCRARVEMIRGS